MLWQTLAIDTTSNTAVAVFDDKQVLQWAIQDRPWYVIKTYSFQEQLPTAPFVLKSNSWKDVALSETLPDPFYKLESLLITARVRLFVELKQRYDSSLENQGIHSPYQIVCRLYNTMLKTTNADAILLANDISTIQELEALKQQVINCTLQAKTQQDFVNARALMERLFFVNILL